MWVFQPVNTWIGQGMLALVVAMFPTVSISQDEISPLGQEPSTEVTPTPDAAQQTAPTERRQLGNVPDDIGKQLRESDELPDSIFPVGPLTPLHKVWEQRTRELRESIGLDLGLNYTSVFQRADSTQSGPRNVSAGDFDFFGRLDFTNCEHNWPGAFVFDSESRHRYSDVAPNALDTGTVSGTIVGFGTQEFSLVQWYWEQGSFDDGLILRVGEMDPALIYDGGRYVSSNYAFLSPAFADTLPMGLPGAGLGFAGAIYPTKSTYILGGFHDANGKRNTAGFDTFFGEAEYFSAVEFGWFPNDGEVNEGMYHVTLWHTDARKKAGRATDRGVAFTMEQQVGCEGIVVPFLRYAYAHRGLNGIRQNLSIGVGFEEILGQNDDIVGIAWSWEDPSNQTLRDQYVFETFYRFQVTPRTHLTPSVQVVIDPTNASNKDAVTVFGIRLRTLF